MPTHIGIKFLAHMSVFKMLLKANKPEGASVTPVPKRFIDKVIFHLYGPNRTFLILVVFHFSRLPFWSSSVLVVFHFGRLPFWSSFVLVVFCFGHVPFCSYSVLVILNFCQILFWSSSILVVFHFGRL